MSAQKIIAEYLAQRRISKHQAKILAEYVRFKNLTKVAKTLDLHPITVSNALVDLRRKGVLSKGKRGTPYILLPFKKPAPVAKKPVSTPVAQPLEMPHDLPIGMSGEECDWMINEYPKYQRNRSEAARILGRTRLEVCQMAIALNIDLRSGGF